MEMGGTALRRNKQQYGTVTLNDLEQPSYRTECGE
jgi:hypothetical protein